MTIELAFLRHPLERFFGILDAILMLVPVRGQQLHRDRLCRVAIEAEGHLEIGGGTAMASADDLRTQMGFGARGNVSADDLALAADEFRKATEIAPDMAAAWYNLGAVLAKTGPVDEAMAAYRRYLALSPGAADARARRCGHHGHAAWRHALHAKREGPRRGDRGGGRLVLH